MMRCPLAKCEATTVFFRLVITSARGRHGPAGVRICAVQVQPRRNARVLGTNTRPRAVYATYVIRHAELLAWRRGVSDAGADVVSVPRERRADSGRVRSSRRSVDFQVPDMAVVCRYMASVVVLWALHASVGRCACACVPTPFHAVRVAPHAGQAATRRLQSRSYLRTSRFL